MSRSIGLLMALWASCAPAVAAASSYASGTLVDGSVRLYSETRSVAMAGGENAWIAEQERLIVADLERLAPGIHTLIAQANASYEEFEPIPWREDLQSCAGRSVEEGECYWALGFDPHIPWQSEASGVGLRIAVARIPPGELRQPFLEQLAVVGDGGTASFEGYGDSPSMALPPFLSTPWPWVTVAVLALLGIFALRRRRDGKRGSDRKN